MEIGIGGGGAQKHDLCLLGDSFLPLSLGSRLSEAETDIRAVILGLNFIRSPGGITGL